MHRLFTIPTYETKPLEEVNQIKYRKLGRISSRLEQWVFTAVYGVLIS